MKIGIFTDTFSPQINGVVTSITTSIDYLSANHSVYVFCPNVKPAVPSTDTVWRFPSFVYPFQKEYRLVWPYHRRIRDIENLGLDIIHIHTPFTMGYVGLRVAKKLGIPAIHTYHTYFEKYLHYFPILPTRWVQKYAQKESERFCNRCQTIIVPSPEMQTLLATYNIHKEMKVLPSGINVYHPSDQEVTHFKERFMPPNMTHAIFIGRVGLEKNIYFLMDAVKAIVQEYPDFHITIIGDGPEKPSLMNRLTSDEMATHVTFTGYLDRADVYCAYHAADVMLFPSKTETQGLTAVESIMCGTPVIGLNEMGIKHVVKHEVSGLLTNDDLDEYVQAIRRYLGDKSLQQALSEGALADGDRFSYKKTGLALEHIYIDTIERYS